MFLQYSPTGVDRDSEGILFKADGDREIISSLGGHNNTQVLSIIKARLSSHSYFSSAHIITCVSTYMCNPH